MKATDFPLYEHLVTLGKPGVERAISDFEAALVEGADEAKYAFVLGLATFFQEHSGKLLAFQIPGATIEMVEKTKKSVIKVLEELTGRGHPAAKVVLNLMKQ